jgi:hypothetical protein
MNLDAYEEQRSESGSFWMTLTETRSTHPFSFHRVAYIRSLFGQAILPIKKSLWGMLFAPIFSIQAAFFIYFAFLI